MMSLLRLLRVSRDGSASSEAAKSSAPASEVPSATGATTATRVERKDTDHGVPPDPRTPTGPGSWLGKCLLQEVIGEGAFGRVFRAQHRTLNIPVAVKVLRTDLLEDSGVRRQLRTEAQLLARLNHPHVVRVWDFEDDVAAPYLVLEYVEGLTLAELINQSGRLAPDRAVRLLTQAAQGLAAAGELGIIHRDLKPANILLTRDGQAKLADLGLALVFGQKSASWVVGPVAASSRAGTAAYAAPEQFFNQALVGPQSDIYALGATFYHALSGRLPFVGPSARAVMLQHATQPLQPLEELVPDIDPALSALISRMMAKEPAGRFADHRDLLEALAGLPRQDPGALGSAVLSRRSTAQIAKISIVRKIQPEPGLSASVSAPAEPKPAVTAPVTSPSRMVPFLPTPKRASGEYSTPSSQRTPQPDGVAALIQQGKHAARCGRPEEALTLLREATKQAPEDVEAWLWLGHTAESCHEALACYQRVLRLSPGHPAGRQGLESARLASATAELQAGSPAAARRILRKLLEQSPGHEKALELLARAAETPQEAEHCWRKLLEINASHPVARAALARKG